MFQVCYWKFILKENWVCSRMKNCVANMWSLHTFSVQENNFELSLCVFEKLRKGSWNWQRNSRNWNRLESWRDISKEKTRKWLAKREGKCLTEEKSNLSGMPGMITSFYKQFLICWHDLSMSCLTILSSSILSYYSIEAACCFVMRVVRLAVEIAGLIPFFLFRPFKSYIQKFLMTQWHF